MKTCPNCATSLPDFVNICTKCKFNFAAPSTAMPPIGSTASLQVSAPTTSISTTTTSSNQQGREHIAPHSGVNSVGNLSPKTNKLPIYIGIGIVVLAAIGLLVSGKSSPDGGGVSKDQVSTQPTKSKSSSGNSNSSTPDVNQIMRDAANKPSNNSTPNRAKDSKNSDGANANKPWYQQ